MKYAYRQERVLPCPQGVTLVHVESELGHASVVSLLRFGGYDKINDMDDYGMIALALAAHNGHSNTVERLLQCEEIGIESSADSL